MTAEFFQHFKGGVYKKIATGKHSETGETLVVYSSCTTGEVWVRPWEMFFGRVEVDGERVPRFRAITLAEKRELINWRTNPCEGTGKAPAEKDIIRIEQSFRAWDGRQIWNKGRALCPECKKNVSFTSKEGISAHKGVK